MNLQHAVIGLFFVVFISILIFNLLRMKKYGGLTGSLMGAKPIGEGKKIPCHIAKGHGGVKGELEIFSLQGDDELKVGLALTATTVASWQKMACSLSMSECRQLITSLEQALNSPLDNRQS